MKFLTQTFATFLFLTLSGCSVPMEELGLFKTDVSLPGANLKAYSDKKIDFEVMKAISLHTCLECHTNGSHSMNTPEKVMAQKEDILKSVHKERMPPRSSGYPLLSTCEVKVLETWIEDQTQGRGPSVVVKDISACGGWTTPPAKPKTDFKNLELTFANVTNEILKPKCLSCHASNSPGYQYVLEDLENIKGNELIAATAEESTLYKVLVPGMTRIFMPKESSGIPALTAEELDFMKRWIDSGAN